MANSRYDGRKTINRNEAIRLIKQASSALTAISKKRSLERCGEGARLAPTFGMDAYAILLDNVVSVIENDRLTTTDAIKYALEILTGGSARRWRVRLTLAPSSDAKAMVFVRTVLQRVE